MLRQQGNELVEVKEYYYGGEPYQTLDKFVQEVKARGLSEVELVEKSRDPVQWGDLNTKEWTLAIVARNISYNFYNKYCWTVEPSEGGTRPYSDASVYNYLFHFLTLAGMHVTEELQKQGINVNNRIWSNKVKPDREGVNDLARKVADEIKNNWRGYWGTK